MRNYTKWIVALVLAAPTMAATAYADDQNENEESHPHETVQMKDLPAAVQKTVQRESKGKTVESIKKETENGKTTYELAVMSNGKGQQIEISESGKVLARHAAHEEKGESEHGGPSK